MKAWRKRLIGSAFLIIVLLISAYLFPRMFFPEGAVSHKDIVSYCVGDATGDGTPELLAISGDGRLDTGERHGDFLLVCDATAEAEIKKHGYIPPEKIQHRIDLSAIKPLKVQLGDVNGDGVKEVAVCVYKTAEFHPIMAKRPFFFDLVDGNLIPVWLGSRLSRPFDDYILCDIDSDAIDEIISVEQLENDNRVIAVYNWRGFGFEMLTQSKEFDCKLYFDTETAGREAGANIVNLIFSKDNHNTRLEFSLDNDNIIFTESNLK